MNVVWCEKCGNKFDKDVQAKCACEDKPAEKKTSTSKK